MSETLTQTLARNPIAASALADGDALPVLDVSGSGIAKDAMMTVAELKKAMARFYVPLSALGDLVAGMEYGYFKARIACKLVGIDFTLQDLPTGQDLIFDLTKAGVAQSKTTTVAPAGNPYGQTIFATALTLAVNDVIRLKPTQVGSGAPGAYLSANLILEPATA